MKRNLFDVVCLYKIIINNKYNMIHIFKQYYNVCSKMTATKLSFAFGDCT